MPSAPPNALKSVLITGATDGLGHAAALLFAEHGYRVAAGGRDAGKLAAIEQLARERHLPLQAFELNVCDQASVDRAVTECEHRCGPVDILINNAGIAILAAMEEISIDDLRQLLETNVLGAVRMSKRVLPGMRQRRRGRIINMSSLAGKVAFPLFGPYSSSKHALEAVSDAMRLELYPFGVQVVLIEPGEINTNMRHASRKLSAAYVGGAGHSPYAGVYRILQSLGEQTSNRDTPEDCARVILRAAEDDPPHARYTVTRPAKFWILARRLLSDRSLDRRIRKAFRMDELAKAIEKGAGD